jgi:hypothetical protein
MLPYFYPIILFNWNFLFLNNFYIKNKNNYLYLTIIFKSSASFFPNVIKSPSEIPQPIKSKQNNDIFFYTKYFKNGNTSNLLPAFPWRYITQGE